MINDVRRRLPFYWSDWVDAWDYRVVPATVYMYFAKYVHHISHSFSKSKDLQCGHDADLNSILPALAFSLDM
jgi:hypothetical protein